MPGANEPDKTCKTAKRIKYRESQSRKVLPLEDQSNEND